MKNHLPARPRPPRFDEAEVPRRDRRSQRELELAEVAPLPPLPQERSRRRCPPRDSHALAATSSIGAYAILYHRLTSRVIDSATPPRAGSNAKSRRHTPTGTQARPGKGESTWVVP